VNPLKALSAATPGPALVIIGKWLKLFSGTIIAYPEWQIDATNLALAVGAVVAIVLPFTMDNTDKARLRALGIMFLSLMFVLVAICVAIWFHLGPPDPGQAKVNVPMWHDIWELSYILAMICLIGSVTFLMLSVDERHRAFFWIVTGIAIVVVIVGILFSIARFPPGRTA
jgi:DMSO reductase anchor subunit